MTQTTQTTAPASAPPPSPAPTSPAPTSPATAPASPSEEIPAHLRESFYAPHPTRWTLFWRTFIPWQIVRFLVINVKMLRIIFRSHR